MEEKGCVEQDLSTNVTLTVGTVTGCRDIPPYVTKVPLALQ